MKSKYYLALFFIGILPVLGLTGVYFGTVLTQPPPPVPKGASNGAAVQTSIQLLKTQVDSMASAMSNSIKSINNDVPTLSAHNSEADLSTFKGTHNGVSGVVVLSVNGKVERMVPSAPPLITDPAYGSSEEFQKAVGKLKENGGQPYLFYTQKLGYPAFVFAVSVSPREVAEVVVGLSNFFRDISANSGDMLFLEAGSGLMLYHTNPSKVGALFNPNQEGWLNKVQSDLAGGAGGQVFNPDAVSAVYSYAGFGKFGIVHLFSSSILQPASPGQAASSKSPWDNPQELIQTPMSLAALICLGWIFIAGSLFWGTILGPLRRATATVLNAANGNASLTPETVSRFGKDEVGQVVQAAAALMHKVDEEKQKAAQEKEEALKRGRAEVDSKTKEAANQASTAQQQVRTAQGELAEKNQLLNDKLKELDAMKGMSEGLRNQAEQAKSESAKLKSQLSAAEAAQEDFKKRLVEAQGKVAEMETKMLTAVAASSTIQVSQVRAAAIRTMAEELKTTLGIIKGYVSSALGTTQGGISEKQQEFLGMVINRSARLEKFINDLVDIYQVEIEQAEAKPEEVNLASEVEGLAFNFQAQAEVKNIKIKVEAKPGLPKVPVVRRRFNQLWNILYLQIIKDAPRGASIPITLEPIGDNVKVTIQDPGLTVAADALPKLFDEFYDPKHPASPQLAGTGLKFALVKTILAAHGGGAVAEKGDPGTKLILTFATKVRKPGAAPSAPAMSPSAAMGLKPPAPGAAPASRPGLGIGAPKPPSPTPGAPPAPPAPVSPAPVGAPKPETPPAPGAKPSMTPGLLDSLISKVPPVTAPGLRPSPSTPPPAAPAPAASPAKPSFPTSAVPGVTAAPVPGAPKPPAPTSGLLDSLIDKKPAPPPGPGVPPAAPRPGVPPVVPMPGMTAPKPPMPGMPSSAPAAPGAPGMPPAAPKPPLGAPPMAPKPAAPPMPGMPSLGMTPGAPSTAPKPSMPGTPGAPVMPGMAAPKVIPTSVKPTAPPPGILDLDNVDGMKLDAGAPKPPAPGAPPLGAPKPPVPPSGGMKPPMPGMPPIPPGGKSIVKDLNKEGEGDLIE